MYESVFKEQSEQLETFTQEALEIIFNSWMILFERQAQYQLRGGKYATPSPELLAQAANVPATNMASERDFGVFDLLLHLKPAARLISHEALVLWTNNKTTSRLNSLSPEDKQMCMAEARANTSKIMARYKERKEKNFQQQKEKLLEKERTKEEAERKQRQQRLNLVSSITEFGGPWKSEKRNQRRSDEDCLRKGKTKSPCYSAPVPESCPPDCSTNQGTFSAREICVWKRIIFSVVQLTKYLTEVFELNQFQEAEPENEGGLTYQSSDERVKSLSEERAKLVKKLRDARQKVMRNKSKAMLPQFQDNPLLLVEKQVMHNCIEDGSEQAKWFNATVLRLAEDIPDGANAIDAEYIIKYDIDEDEDEWTMPLLKDLKKRI